jgi:hypothetical protein
MHFFKTLLAGAALVASSVLAQEPLVFTTFPSNVVAGTPVTVTWAGGNPNEVCFLPRFHSRAYY